MNDTVIDSVFRKTINELSYSPMVSREYLDFILFLLYWKYVSDKRIIDANISLSSSAWKDGTLLDERKLAEVISFLEKHSKVPSIVSPNVKHAKAVMPKLIELWKSELTNYPVDDFFSQDSILSIFSWITDFLGTSEQSALEFTTPSDVVRLMSKLIDGEHKASLYDPNCRTGNLLFTIANKLGSKEVEGETRGSLEYRIAKTQSILLESDAIIELGGEHSENKKTFDIVVTNPPFGKSDFRYFEPFGKWAREFQSNRTDILFLTHVIDKLSKRGKGLVIMPNHFLFGAGQTQMLRRALIKENIIDGIVYLPARIFYNTGVSASIIAINKSKIDRDVLLIDATKFGYREKNKTILNEDEILLVTTIFNRYNSNDFKNSDFISLVTTDEIERHDYDLQFTSYKVQKPQLNLRPSNEILNECMAIEEKIAEVQKQLGP
ncbi:MAG: hypothetical protein EBR30_12775 [Cytophagia bacterium]|nr:hypothetical protein [Cytophagia bacterium]